jgi:type IV secretory pathway VirB10-like protein
MGDKINNVQSMMNNPKQRNIYLMGVGVALVTLVAGFIFATSSKDEGPKGAAQISKMPKVDAAPGSSESPLYNNKVKEANGKDADKALEEGKTFVPTPINNDALSSESPLDALDKQINAQKEAEAREQVEKQAQAQQAMNEQPVANQGSVSANQPTQPLVAQQTEVVQTPPPPPPKPKKYGSDDDFLIMQALTGVANIKASKSESDYLGQGKANSSQNAAQQVGMPMAQVGSGNTGTQKGNLIAKSGTIFNAVLETGINSDEPSPVLAKIVSGDLKGTRLIGNISVAGEKVIVRFTTASVPEFPTSIRLTSVAVDPGTSRTGLATDVDRHHFLKYGVLLSAAFIGSYADAIANNNSTTTITPEGSVVTTKGKMSTKDMTRQAGGTVGKELANDTRQKVQGLKPTITVDAGTPIGILIMEDLYSGQ